MKPTTTTYVVPQPSTTVKATEKEIAMITKTVFESSRLTTALFLLAIALGGFVAISADAQSIRNTDYSPDKVLKSNARVNPSTLAMELSIPVIGYPGRAGNGKSATFSYSSKVWGMDTYNSWESPLGFHMNDIRPRYAKGTAAGWSSSLGTARLLFSTDVYRNQGNVPGEYPVDGQIFVTATWENPPPDGDIFYVKRVQVHMPDGSTHEMRASDEPVNCGTVLGNGCTPVDYTGTYLSVDGSRMRLESGSSSSVLYLPDGGRYVFGTTTGALATATATYDAHGNKSAYNTSTRAWTDTMGRVIDDPFPDKFGGTADGWGGVHGQTVGTVTAEFPGFGGSSTYDVDFEWAELEDALLNTSDALRYTAWRSCSGQGSTAVSPYLFGAYDSFKRMCTLGGLFNPVVLKKITLPNGQYYEFKYNVYGEIAQVIYPSGAYERFVYAPVPTVTQANDVYDVANRGVTDRYLSEKGDGTDELHWTYAVSAPPYAVTTTAADGSYTKQFIYTEPYAVVLNPYGFSSAYTGRAYEDRVYDDNDNLRSKQLTEFALTGPLGSGAPASATRDMRPVKEISIIFEPGDSNALATMTETVYDTTGSSDPAYFSSLNPKQSKTYDYVVVSATTAASANITTAEAWFSSSAPSVVTEMDYLYNENYKARNINGLVTETRVKDAAGNIKAKTQISYDDSGHAESSTGTMPTAAANSWLDPVTELGSTVGAKRGLPTTVKGFYDIANGYYVETKSFYDQYGNVRRARDGGGNDSWVAYDDDYAFAYPTSTTTPTPDSTGTHGSNTAFTTTATYDYNTGLPLSSTDINGQTTMMEYDDPLLRPKKVTAPNGHQTITEYGAGTSASTRWVKARSQIDGTNWKEAISWFDGLGRGVLSQSVVADDDDIFVVTCYDDMGRVLKTSNPVRSSTALTCASSLQWTTPGYDDFGRNDSVTTPDGAVVTTAYGLATAGSEIGTVVTVTDQAGKLRRSVTNALGQLKRVDEPDGSNALGTIDSPNQPTLYTYDWLNNLIAVQQDGDTTDECGGASTCTQTRTFTYDALSRLKQALNPESGTINYTYDNNSNLITKTDARTITTTYAYDALNRVKTRNYSGESGFTTPNVSYFYDNLTNAKGRLTKVSSSVSTTEYTSFDILGRVTGHKQTTDGEEYETDYTYNLSGALIEQTYPSGRKVKNVIDNNGDLSMVQSARCLDSTPGTNAACTAEAGLWNYAKNFTYNPAGAVTSMQLGNNRWESTQFNSRLQPTQIALGVTPGATNLLKLDYEYGATAAVNNGNVTKQTITVPTVGQTPGFTAVQNYTYDSLNRLKSATETIGGNSSWQQTFKFDRYGNRNFDEALTTTLPKECNNNTEVCAATRPIVNPSVNTSNNRLIGYLFDNAGNTVRDAESRRFTYDGENKQVKVETLDANGNPVSTVGEYSYDGDGRRIKKDVPSTGEVTMFVYDAGGKLIGEYSTIAAPQSPTVSYTTADHLGSPRILTDENGATISRRDFHPFGEEISTTDRSAGLGYQPDDVRQKYTGYERDNESSLDFAEARYYGYGHGRFTSVDPIMMTRRRLLDPQSINLYVYTRNNPLRFIDPTGREFKGTDGEKVIIEKEDGKWVIKSNNASKHLQRLVNLVNNSGSSTANSQFHRLNAHKTMINFAFGDKDPQGPPPKAFARHEPHGTASDGSKVKLTFNSDTRKFEGGTVDIEKDANGNEVYREATITIYEGEYLGTKQEVEDAMVASFGHEAEHDLDLKQVQETKNETYRNSVYHPAGKGSPDWMADQIRREIQEHRRQETINTFFNRCPTGMCF